MRRGTIFVIIFIVVAIVVVGLSEFLRAQPPLELTVAASPLAEAWLQEAVNGFNATNPVVNSTRRVRFNVQTIDDMAVWQDERRTNWTPENHPAAWIPASSMSVQYARDARFPVEIAAPSVARTLLVWGGYGSRTDVVTQATSRPLDWDAVVEAARTQAWANLEGGQSNWGFVKLAFARPDQAVSGLAVLLSGAAHFADDPSVTGAVVTGQDFRQWFGPVARSVANFNTLGGDPAGAMASRGASVAEIGLLPESRWLVNLDGLLRNEDVVLAYPRYPFVFDFPVARWNDVSVSVEERQAVEALIAWLVAAPRQSATVNYGLRPIDGVIPETASLFSAAAPYGIMLDVPVESPVTPPTRTEVQRLLQWFNTVR